MTLDNDFYTSLEEAGQEIWKRWNDKDLERSIDKFLNGAIPACFKNNPKAVLARNIISPDNEFHHFLSLSKKVDLPMQFIELKDDKFVTSNPDKYCLGKMRFFGKKGKKGGHQIDVLKIIDISKSQGKSLQDIKTFWNNSLVDFHHGLAAEAAGGDVLKKIYDLKNWEILSGSSLGSHYIEYLSLFLRNGILFENYTVNDVLHCKDFTNGTFKSAFMHLSKTFGIKPLIVPLIPLEEEGNPYWEYHPISTKEIIEKTYLKRQ